MLKIKVLCSGLALHRECLLARSAGLFGRVWLDLFLYVNTLDCKLVS